MRKTFFAFSILLLTVALSRFSSSTDANLDSQIGQMLMVGFRGLLITDQDKIAADIKQRGIGGVILFDYDVPARRPVRNIESPEQLRNLVRSLRQRADTTLLVAIDQEGGRVNRLKERFGFPATVSAQHLGSLDRIDSTKEYADLTALALKQAGINLNFAPVLDLNTNPDNPVIGKLERSFSADPDIVTRHALAWVEAHRRFGVLCGLKHFPGHGSSRADSHLGFVDVSDTWDESELEPYRALIKAGKADIVMTAHIFNRHLDPELPGTLSSAVVSDLLRRRLGFTGVVVSDDLQMKAISDHYGLETAVEKAVNAGVDILVFGNNSEYDPDIAARSIAALKKLVSDGKISPQRIQESYARITQLKSGLEEDR